VTLLLRRPVAQVTKTGIQEVVSIETSITRDARNFNFLSYLFMIMLASSVVLMFVVHKERLHWPGRSPYELPISHWSGLAGPLHISRAQLARSTLLPSFDEHLTLREILSLLDERQREQVPRR